MAARSVPERRIRAEILIVLGLSLGQSAIFAALRLLERYLHPAPIGNQVTTLNVSQSQVDYLDLTLQILRIGFSLLPVALAWFLLSHHGQDVKTRWGLVRSAQPDATPQSFIHSVSADVLRGWLLAAIIGLPGLALYGISRALGHTVLIDTSGLPDEWWRALVLLLSAAAAGILEESIAVAYLFTRLRDLRWSAPVAILATALLRGSYHLYQGWPMALGNVVMGLVFGWYFWRKGRLGPLILAHWTLDAVAFIGPDLIPADWLRAIHGLPQ